MYASIATLALAVSTVVAKDFVVSLGGVTGVLSISDKDIAGGLDVEGILAAGGELKLSELPVALPIPVSRHRRHHNRQLGGLGSLGSLGSLGGLTGGLGGLTGGLGNLAGISSIFTGLSGELAPVLSTITGLVANIEAPAQQIASELESHLGDVTSLLQGGLGKLQGLTGIVDSLGDEVATVTKEAAAETVSTVYADIAQALSTVKAAESQIPVIGPILVKGTDEIQAALAGLTGQLSTLSAPLVQELKGALAPLQSVLGMVGLGSITSVVDGVLRH